MVRTPLRRPEAASDAPALGTGPLAGFRVDMRTGRWWWSDAMYELHGFARGDIVPSAELILAHNHPDDRTEARKRLARVLSTGEPLCCRHRIVTANGDARTVLLVADGSFDSVGHLAEVRGYLLDLTSSWQHYAETMAHEAVERSAEARGVIEQAKGILIAAHGIDADAAFALLRWHSQHSNTRLRVLADGLVQRFSDGGTSDLTAMQRVEKYLALAAVDAHAPSPLA
jgi:hypothetical protein